MHFDQQQPGLEDKQQWGLHKSFLVEVILTSVY
jgi:hypothetical protein